MGGPGTSPKAGLTKASSEALGRLFRSDATRGHGSGSWERRAAAWFLALAIVGAVIAGLIVH